MKFITQSRCFQLNIHVSKSISFRSYLSNLTIAKKWVAFGFLTFIFRRRLSDGVVHEPHARHTDPGPRVPLPGDGHTLGDGQMTSNETAQIPDWTVSNIFKFGPGFEIESMIWDSFN